MELKCDSYSSEDWQECERQYEKLVEKFSSSDRKYTEAEKQMAARAMGRYHALLIRHGIEQSVSFFQELGSILPSYLEGLSNGFDESASELEKLFEGKSAE
ncbi:MAG: hypothetical protein NC308_07435 [Clostridium sp.]|nr:hypothetical protein [Bacteroides sp.]MCM1198705.1 hypothetical protein [Clostridium sp.]